YVEGEPPPAGNYILSQQVDESGKILGMFWVDPAKLAALPSKMQHENIDELLPMVRWTWRHVKPYFKYSAFEEWERGFLQDKNVVREVAHWVRITYAFLTATHKNPKADKKSIFTAVNLIANGAEHRVQPAQVRKSLKRLLEDPPRFLFDVENF